MADEPQDEPETPQQERRELAVQMSALGLEFSGAVLGGLATGYAFDRWLGTTPWGVLIGVLGGFVTAVARILQLTRKFDKLRRERD